MRPAVAGLPGGKGGPAVAGKAASPAAPTAKGTAGTRVSARRLQELHLTASRRFGAPELALSNDESAELQDAVAKIGELTGFVPAGPFWDWLAVVWTFVLIYGYRLSEIAARKRAAIAGDPPVPTRPAPPAARAAAAPPPPSPLARAPAQAGSAEVPIDARGAFVPLEPGAPLPDSAARFLTINGGNVAGITPDVPGVPRTTLAERTGDA